MANVPPWKSSPLRVTMAWAPARRAASWRTASSESASDSAKDGQEVGSQREGPSVDRRDGEESAEIAHRLEAGLLAERLAEEVVHDGDGRRVEDPFELSSLDPGHETGGCRRERPAVEEEIEPRLGVEEHLQRCFSSRWRR